PHRARWPAAGEVHGALSVRPRRGRPLPWLCPARRGRACRQQLPGPGPDDILLLTIMRGSPLFRWIALLPIAAACQTYVSPPVPTIEGLTNGLLSNPSAPLVIDFSKAIDPATLSLKVIKFDPNSLGQLP